MIGHIDRGCGRIGRTALDLGAFDGFVLPYGMVGDALIEEVGGEFAGSFGTMPGTDTGDGARLAELAAAAGIGGAGPYQGESYDAVALLALAIHAAGMTEGRAVAARMAEVANAPGRPIGPGDLARALEIISSGGDIDHVDATDVELSEVGEARGHLRELEIKGGAFRARRLW